MSTQICYLATGLSITLMLTTVFLWLSAEREINRNIRDFYRVPRVNKYPYKPGWLRRLALSLIGRKRYV